ncbi:MAG: DNA translocase FtsK 4TM domain-containing protein [Eubacteriales bacterium]
MAQTKRKTTASKTSQKSNKKAIDDLREKEVFEKKIKQNRINHEIWAIVTIALGVFFAIAIQTTAAGKVGELIHHFFCGLFGNVGGIIPYYIVTYGVLLLFNKTGNSNKKSIILFSLTFLMISLMYSERFIDISAISFKYITLDKWYIAGIAGQSGGAVGMMAALLVLVWFGKTGLYIFGIATIMVSLLLLSNSSSSQFLFN